MSHPHTVHNLSTACGQLARPGDIPVPRP
ncbi:hypothetical protein FHX42_004997 [Saccharopolyspora lacisalsi]|uniref:Uncharacterized protein n=1 Tax=Halosaccharopolyspora lacisalsi TaxID=1000566 RepID=A0A839E8K0_9PSEU|nr:hypothetical protein [Halosaccharopolyspora lacisalsi]